MQNVTRWKLPSIGEMDEQGVEHTPDLPSDIVSDDLSAADAPMLPTAEQMVQWEQESREAGYKEGYDAGHLEGYSDGKLQAEQDFEVKRNQLESLLETLSQNASPYAEMDESVEQELMHLAVAIAQQLVRREIRSSPGEVIGVIRESIALLPSNARHITLQLHPEDAELVRASLPGVESENGWKLVEDPLVSRGGCNIMTDQSRIDATLESRLASLAATILGGSRDTDA